MTKTLRIAAVLSAAALAAGIRPAAAGYDRHPELAPSERCEARGLPASDEDCQPLFWDLDAAAWVGQRAVAVPDAATGYPGGMTDRPPPLYVEDGNGDGALTEADAGAPGFELHQGVASRLPMCPKGTYSETGALLATPDATVRDPDLVPWWRPTGETETVAGQARPVFEVACRRGTRAYYGPWRLDEAPDAFDAVAFKVVEFENSARVAGDGREWNVGNEVYTHVGAHHATCDVSNDPCNDAHDPAFASSPACEPYRRIADDCPAEGGGLGCPEAQQSHSFVLFRTTSARQGRYLMELPGDRGFPTVEDPLWLCQNHVLNDEPRYTGPGNRDFRRQGGAVGEMVIQLFAEPWGSGERGPVNTVFDFILQRATTYVPPFTVMPQTTVWYAPFDLAIGTVTMHSHRNMVKGTVQVVPANPVRTGPRVECGASPDGVTPAGAIYTNYDYFEPPVCEYWKEADGPIVLRKGDALYTQCIVNNGVTHTDRIEDEALRAAVEGSPVGQEILYGRQAPETYRVRYGCEEIEGVPPGRPAGLAAPTGRYLQPVRDCPPNPATGDGRPVDGPYDAGEFCPKSLGYTGRCVPASVVFRNTGTDAMCIPIVTYWPLERIVRADGTPNEAAIERLANGETDDVGTPGRLPKSPADAGQCDDGAGEDGIHVEDPSPFSTTKSRRCRGGL